MELNERIGVIRRHLKLTQKAFGEKIGVAGNTVTNYENGRREPMEATIKAICREFNVNYDWLKYGEGDMFEALGEDVLSDIFSDYNLDDLDQQIIRSYIRMNKNEREVIKKYIRSLLP